MHRPDVPMLLGGAALAGALARVLELAAPQAIVTAWATVDIERAARELGGGPGVASTGIDELLGAHVRGLVGPDGAGVLLEPATEGPLAAALARHGEGPLAIYLRADARAADRLRRAGFRLSAPGSGPFGPERRVLVGRRDGPFVLLVG